MANRLALTIAEAAAALGVSERHLRRMLPEIPRVYIGRRAVIPVEALREWLRQSAYEEAGRVDRILGEILDGLRR